MKNTAKKTQPSEEKEYVSLDEYVSSNNGKTLYVRLHRNCDFLEAGDLVVVHLDRKPTLSDLVLYQIDGTYIIKRFSEVEKSTKPLRLVARNGEPVQSKTENEFVEILGTVTHMVKTLVN